MSHLPILRHHFRQISSTNDWAKRHAHLFDKHLLTIVTAEEQTAGRGQFSRKWISPAHVNLYASFCFFLPQYPSDITPLSLALALATQEALRPTFPQLTIKLPNDLMLSGKKVGGILTETLPIHGVLFVVSGLGLNVNMELKDLSRIDQPATSLMVENGKTYPLAPLLATITERFQLQCAHLLPRN